MAGSVPRHGVLAQGHAHHVGEGGIGQDQCREPLRQPSAAQGDGAEDHVEHQGDELGSEPGRGAGILVEVVGQSQPAEEEQAVHQVGHGAHPPSPEQRRAGEHERGADGEAGDGEHHAAQVHQLQQLMINHRWVWGRYRVRGRNRAYAGWGSPPCAGSLPR